MNVVTTTCYSPVTYRCFTFFCLIRINISHHAAHRFLSTTISDNSVCITFMTINSCHTSVGTSDVVK